MVASALRGSNWQGKVEGRALAQLAVDPDRAALRLDDRVTDVEPEAGAGNAARGMGAAEFLEYAGRVFLADANAVVDNADRDQRVVARDVDIDRLVVGREFLGVAHEVADDLPVALLVAERIRDRTVGVHAELAGGLVCGGNRNLVDRAAYKCLEVEGRDVVAELA